MTKCSITLTIIRSIVTNYLFFICEFFQTRKFHSRMCINDLSSFWPPIVTITWHDHLRDMNWLRQIYFLTFNFFFTVRFSVRLESFQPCSFSYPVTSRKVVENGKIYCKIFLMHNFLKKKLKNLNIRMEKSAKIVWVLYCSRGTFHLQWFGFIFN
jgi:hypothetical protein